MLTFDSLQSFETCVKWVCYSHQPMALYFQLKFLKLNALRIKKSQLKCIEKWEKEKILIIEKTISQRTRKKIQGAKERYYRDSESRRQYQKSKYQENPVQEKEYGKSNITKILNGKNNMKKRTNMKKIWIQKKKIAKRCIKKLKRT